MGYMTCCVPFFFFSTSEYFHRSLLRFPLLLLPLLYEPPRTATALWRDSDRFRTGKETGKGEALRPAVVLNRDCLFFFLLHCHFFFVSGRAIRQFLYASSSRFDSKAFEEAPAWPHFLRMFENAP